MLMLVIAGDAQALKPGRCAGTKSPCGAGMPALLRMWPVGGGSLPSDADRP